MSTMAEVLAEHIPHTESLAHCLCGNYDAWTPTSHAEHVAAILTVAGFGDVREAGARALEEAASDFEDNMGVGEFDEWARRDGARWNHIEESWEHQGPYMDWLRARAASLRGEE
jgi:hypothetical protein